MKDPHIVSFSPMHHWTEPKIRVHTFYCVLALAIARLMTREAERARTSMSVTELLTTLAGIQETVLLYPSTGGRPKASRKTTDLTDPRFVCLLVGVFTRRGCHHPSVRDGRSRPGHQR